ncbi:threonylcarbamoyl-AMP synthase [Aeromicrobium tamlense]|uniref:Threonylcarbamoyl-AMP synthase n=1 Tax=Aeromicrobium tamlense TaxID=375541 RepID=A0A8I0FU03_9ACTN|nr:MULTISPECIES: L-threonylcarbamoyladenylate synthase [Aeromicrobium]MBD1270495.1 threonylcarbamoyl-AMP synthase [Aeromicrobium tamlense]MBD1271373.1 threonylcarbamoyl-AMP synthase [Aeromicrobium tamlense]NYI37882.1 tRNA threonylcarbamoyl adenosine modification protein (Sua5/YciO/YrdC/YwlC family) [Aeromicrobium tamlense]
MVRYFDIHPVDPQQRTVDQTVALLRGGGLIAYPTDSGYALGAQVGNADAIARIRDIRGLDDKHHFTLVCRDFAQLGQFVHVDNAVFRAVKAATPGPYTFILPGTPEVPKRLLQAKKKTVGVRISTHRIVRALVEELGEPILSSTLILPGETEPMTQAWQIGEELGDRVDAIVDSGEEIIAEPTTVVDLSEGYAEVTRVGAGDPTPFE